ncbi:site-specific integrase [Yangia mangrovi]|uniref:Integrase n=1 Tax=Alloyangia mangrovi TaxID=1779329 RepID=A0A2A3K0Y9_9RHOB|nr:site-specific integrase [Alloyangia mangrovi]MCT4372045.1 site-specific integrase [Alloyangia mangrovi]
MISTHYEVGRLKGRYVVTWYETQREGAPKKRRRFRLNATRRQDALLEAKRLYESRVRDNSQSASFNALWDMYSDYLKGRPTEKDLENSGKCVKPFFQNYGPMEIDNIAVEGYLKERKERFHERFGRAPSRATLYKDVNLIKSVLNWAHKELRAIPEPRYIRLPEKAEPKDRYLDLNEIDALLKSARKIPHIYVAIALMLGTAGRVGAILELTWDSVNFETRTIDLRVDLENKKPRAKVPMNDGLCNILMQWRSTATTRYVVEFRGKRLGSIKKGFASVVRDAKLNDVSPHIMRHTAAVHMVVNGSSMEKVSSYLGHSSLSVTRKVYARHRPDHLREEAEKLDFFDGDFAPLDFSDFDRITEN